MKANRVIGVDLGGTKILAGVIERDGTVAQTVERPTVTTSQAAMLDEIADVVRKLRQDDVVAVGIGVPSRIDQRTGIALGAVNIPLHEVNLREEMEQRVGLPVGLENDANAATYAEFVLGTGRDVSDLLMLTLGTGVGGGIVIGGKLFRGWAELGHMVIVEDGEPCQGACSGRGHVEAYCSGRAADKLAREVLGGDANAYDLVEQKHPVLEGIGHHLGVAIGSLVNIFNPQVVVIGGGFGLAAFDLLLPATRLAALTEALAPAGQQLEFRRAQLGARAGLIGAGLVAFEVT